MVRCYLQFFQKAFLYKDYSHGTDKVKLGCYESLSKGYNVLMSLLLTLTLDAMSHNGQ